MFCRLLLVLLSVILEYYEQFEDTKGVIRICISKTNRQYNGHRKQTKEPTTIYKNFTHKTKDQVTGILLKKGL
jgi:hypothetical protein